MIHQVLTILVLFSSVVLGQKIEVTGNSSIELGICGYQATCSAGGHSGVCVSIGAGCCNGGSVTSGLCPG